MSNSRHNQLHGVIIGLILVLFICTCIVSAEETGKLSIKPLPVSDKLVSTNSIQSVSAKVQDDNVEYLNLTTELSYWNTQLRWGLTQKQVSNITKKLETGLLNASRSTNGKLYHIKNLTEFDITVGKLAGLSTYQTNTFVKEHRNQLEKSRNEFSRPYTPKTTTATNSISSSSILATTSNLPSMPSSQSAPSAVGRVFYMYIFVDFTTPSPYGSWTQAEIDETLRSTVYAQEVIRSQAPANAQVVNNGGWARVTVPGENLGTFYDQTWGVNGWMEQAAKLFNCGNANVDKRYTEGLVRYLKYTYAPGTDSVMLVYLTHDNKGATAVGTDQGYADKVVVSYWGNGYKAEPGVYEHEILHAYGALDEYQGGNGIGCNLGPSGLAVLPMKWLYKNTNYYTCGDSTEYGVMYYPYSTLRSPAWFEISQSTKNFIGWGDYDKDGIIDPKDPIPCGADNIGIYRNRNVGAAFYLDTNKDGFGEKVQPVPSNWVPSMGDWNGDGRTENGVYNAGVWLIDYDGSGGYNSLDKYFGFGSSGWAPIVGDWNGDGAAEVGCYKDGIWYLDYDDSFGWNVGDRVYIFGCAGCIPVLGDWNRDGKTEIGVYYNGGWYFDYDGNGAWTASDKFAAFGSPGWAPVVGDWNGDKILEVGCYKDGSWYLDYDGSSGWTAGDKYIIYGTANDIPLIGDWQAKGVSNIGVYRPSTQGVYFDYNNDGIVDKGYIYGIPGDIPVVGKW